MDTSKFNLVIGGKTKRSTLGQHSVEIDWNAAPDVSQEFIIRYGLKQWLADAMAGKTTEDEARTAITERMVKFSTGDFSRTRETGDKPDSVDLRAFKNAKAAIRAMLSKQNAKADKVAIADAAKKLVNDQPKWRAEAKKQLEAEAKAAEAIADDEMAETLADLLKS